MVVLAKNMQIKIQNKACSISSHFYGQFSSQSDENGENIALFSIS